MSVSAGFAEKVIFDFRQDAKSILTKYDIDHLRGTEKIKPVLSVAEEFISLIQNNYASAALTESSINSEKRMYLRTLELAAMKLQRQEQAQLAAISAIANPTKASDDAAWSNVISATAREIERTTSINKMILSADPLFTKSVDAKFSAILNSVEQDFVEGKNPNQTLNRVLRDVNKLNKHIKSYADKKARANMRNPRREKAPKNQLQGYLSGQTSGAGIGGLFGSSSRNPIRGRNVPLRNPGPAPVYSKAYNTKPPGMSGFAGTMSADEIRAKHPPGTNEVHINAMHHFMSEGMSFEEAHNLAEKRGFPAKGMGGHSPPFR